MDGRMKGDLRAGRFAGERVCLACGAFGASGVRGKRDGTGYITSVHMDHGRQDVGRRGEGNGLGRAPASLFVGVRFALDTCVGDGGGNNGGGYGGGRSHARRPASREGPLR